MENKIIIKGARTHNLKNINLELPKNKIIVFTGVSGSGKSSLAFDTIFAEGQRRYIESLSPYARQFLGQLDRADVDEIIGLSPAIAIGQKALSHNPRSTVGTLTEIYNLSLEEMVDIILEKAKKNKEKKVSILSPIVRGRKGEYYQLFYDYLSLGFSEARVDGRFLSLHEKLILSRYKPHTIEIVIDRLMINEESRLFEAVENALNIGELATLPIDKLTEFFNDYEKSLGPRQKIIGQNVLKEIKDRLDFLLMIGLNYLSLEREAETLSGGEAQRIRMSSQIGSHLSNTLYVLDEPTIGLHERDTQRLINTLKSLRDRNNTVIVVEHDERTILESDYLADLGPMAGKNGGEVVISGEIQELLKKTISHDSLTVDYLIGRRKIPLPENRRKKIHEKLKIIGGRANNLKNINVDIPLRKLVCFTGVSGSGKSSLLYDVLYKNLTRIKSRLGQPLENVSQILGAEYVDKVIMVDQSPIGRTPRSNPATYTGIFTPIRQFFALLPEA